MIRFTSLLMARSTKWVAPAILTALWTLLVMSGGTETAVSRSGGMLFCYVIVGLWLTIMIGNVDDDAHRELVTAVVGSRSRLHLWRALTSLLWVGGYAVALTLGSLLIHRHTHSLLVETTGALGLALSGALLGVGLGTPLHRPIVRNQSTSLVVGIGLAGLLIVLSPMQQVVKRASNNDVVLVPRVLGVSLVLAFLSAIVSGIAATHRRT